MYPMQKVDGGLAKRAGIPVPKNEWDRHNYEAMLPGFGGSDSMDWREFVRTLQERGFTGPFEIENEAALSKGTGNLSAIMQGFRATTLNLAPMLWPLGEQGYQYDEKGYQELKQLVNHDIPVVTMKDLEK